MHIFSCGWIGVSQYIIWRTGAKSNAISAILCGDQPPRTDVTEHRIFRTPFSKVYPMYIKKAEAKNRTREELDQIICWLTGYDEAGLRRQIELDTSFADFFGQAPAFHPNAALIKGVVCGIRVENIEDPLMQKLRYLDKLVDELAKGKAMEKILRQ